MYERLIERDGIIVKSARFFKIPNRNIGDKECNESR